MVFSVWCLVFVLSASALSGSTPNTKHKTPNTALEHPISETLRASRTARPGERITVTLAVDIPNRDKTWHLYSITQAPGGPIRTEITVGPDGDFEAVGSITATPPVVADDPNFGIPTETYTDSAIFRIPVVVSPTASGKKRLAIAIYYQTCNDRYCLPPVRDSLFADVMVGGEVIAGSEWKSVPNGVPESVPNGVPKSDAAPVLPGNGSLGLFLWIAAVTGALSLLTPCVFPMVPITISYFSREGSRGRARAVRDAAVYAAGIIVAFTSLGLGLALVLGATGLNRFAANPWLNLAIAALFAAFALSLFGVLHLGVPGQLLTRIDGLTRSTRFGRDGTTLLMGATFALTSFTCTAPFVGTLLVSATQGNWKWPALGLLTFSAVFALPFLVLALVPQALNRLPRSGEWMVTIKVALGFIELAAAMKFLSNADLVEGWGVFTRQVVLGTWVALGTLLALYLLGTKSFQAIAHVLDGKIGNTGEYEVPSGGRLVGCAAAVLFTFWIGTGLRGQRLGELEPFLPPAGANAGGVANENELTWVLNDYEGALARAKAENKQLLIDFTGYTCTNCRWMEANMFPRPEIRKELERFVRVRLFTDGQQESNVRQQRLEEERFNTVALPLYAIIDPDGSARGQFLGMTRKTDEFLAFLSAGSSLTQREASK